MAYTSLVIRIGGRKVRFANGTYGGDSRGKTQTVNVCDSSNALGRYQQVYRIEGYSNFVQPTEIASQVRSIDELDALLLRLGFVREGPR